MKENNLKVTLGYIPENCIEESAVEIREMSITYSQPADTNSHRDEYQFLTITMKDNGMGEDGIYYDISTKDCHHWSISSPDDISKLVKDFESRMKYNTVSEKDLKVYKSNKKDE